MGRIVGQRPGARKRRSRVGDHRADVRADHALGLVAHRARRRGRLRDYLVVPDAAHPEILLGKALLQLGPLRVFSNYFVIEPLRPTTWSPPREELTAGA